MSLTCPSCTQPMALLTLPAHYGRSVEIDVCHPCSALWFDRMESVALTPDALLQLVRDMHDRQPGARHPLPELLRCPRDAAPLRASPRRTQAGAYTVYACATCAGQMVPFFEFLREKGLLRPLSKDRLAELRDAVGVVNCSSCGAPVDLHRSAHCSHCSAPLALLDVEAIGSALAELQARADRRANPNPDVVTTQMMLDKLKTERTFRKLDRIHPEHQTAKRTGGWGLLEACLDSLAELWMNR